MDGAEKTHGGGADAAARFYHLIDALEEHLDRGFFLSFIGKIVVDEKKIYSLLNELRALTPEAVRNGALRGALRGSEPRAEQPAGRTAHIGALQQAEAAGGAEGEAARVRLGADKYADDVLGELEGRLRSISEVVRHGRDVLKERIQNQEVK